MVTNIAAEMAASPPHQRRQSASERREAIVTEAIRHFAQSGYSAASTDAIARDAGISQPYLFRLFGTKRDLFLACHEVCHARIRDAFREAAAGAPPEGRLEAMGKAYVALLEDRVMLRFQMHAYAATADPEIRAQVRARYGELIQDVRRLTGAGPEALWGFFGSGMLLNVIAALDMPTVGDVDAWVALWDCDA